MISNLSGDDLFRPRPTPRPRSRFAQPFAVRPNEVPTLSTEGLVTDRFPPLVVDAEVTDWGPWAREQVAWLAAKVELEAPPAPEAGPEDADRAQAWAASRLREIVDQIEPVTFEPLEFDPELEQWGHEWWEARRPVVPSPRPRSNGKKVS